MNTRSKSAVRDLEHKLSVTLRELKTSRELCQRLLQERDDSELEIKKVVDKNTHLKDQLSILDIKYMNILDQHNELQSLVNTFDQCSETHVQALKRISDLESELMVANQLVSNYDEANECQQVNNNKSLYQELCGMGINKMPLLSSTEKCTISSDVIDLTVDDKKSTQSPHTILSHNKIKKYIKIGKIINKSQKLIKRNKVLHTNVHLRRERIDLIRTIDSYKLNINENKIKYETNTKLLQSKIIELESLLDYNCKQYELTKKTNKEIDLAMSHLLETCKYNEERFQSLVNNHSCICEHSSTVTTDCQSNVDITSSINQSQINKSNFNLSPEYKTIVFTDGIGKGIGVLLNECMDQQVTNICMPGASYSQIVDCLLSGTYDCKTNIILLIGNGMGVRKKHVLQCCDSVKQLNINKFIMCAFPYLESQNQNATNHLYSLNSFLYNLTCHSDFLFFDTNLFIPSFKCTHDTMYLPIFYKKQIAKLLAFNIIHTVISNITVSCKIDTSEISCNTKPSAVDLLGNLNGPN